VENRKKEQFHSIRNFFVISPENVNDYIVSIRKNILDLVHYGFSREEVYFMPAGEVMDYIKIINDRIDREEEQRKNNEMNSSKKPITPDFQMAGNTLARG